MYPSARESLPVSLRCVDRPIQRHCDSLMRTNQLNIGHRCVMHDLLVLLGKFTIQPANYQTINQQKAQDCSHAL